MSEPLDNKVLKGFAEQQHKELVRLLELNKSLEAEVEHLKNMLTANDSFLIKKPIILTNEELICIEQIKILKDLSTQGQLTLEECKKFSEYVKTLKGIRNKEDVKEAPLKQFSTEDLIKMVDDVQG